MQNKDGTSPVRNLLPLLRFNRGNELQNWLSVLKFLIYTKPRKEDLGRKKFILSERKLQHSRSDKSKLNLVLQRSISLLLYTWLGTFTS
jgi:hypothetical protein